MANREDLLLNFKWALYAILICTFLRVTKSVGATKVPYASSHTLSDGTIVDCVKVEEQPTLQDLKFKDHVVQQSLSANLFSSIKLSGPGDKEAHVQLFQREIGSCPQGTIPIQRMDKEMLKTRLHLRTRRHKKMQDVVPGAASSANIEASTNGIYHRAMGSTIGAFWGGQSYISVWNIKLEDNGTDFVSSYMSVGHRSPANTNNLEVGWHVYPAIYKEEQVHAKPHLYIQWTADSGESTGCYNLDCVGFVQTNSGYLLGGAFTDDSNGHCFMATIARLNKANGSADWWLYLDGVEIGYWPHQLFTQGQLLDGLSNMVQWGGEVRTSSPTSTVEMGNGIYGSKGVKAVKFNDVDSPAYHASISYLAPTDDGASLKAAGANNLHIQETDSTLYDTNFITGVKADVGIASGTWLFFGGPGVASGSAPPPS